MLALLIIGTVLVLIGLYFFYLWNKEIGKKELFIEDFNTINEYVEYLKKQTDAYILNHISTAFLFTGGSLLVIYFYELWIVQ